MHGLLVVISWMFSVWTMIIRKPKTKWKFEMQSIWNCRKEKQEYVQRTHNTKQYNSSINNCWSASTSYFHSLQHSSRLHVVVWNIACTNWRLKLKQRDRKKKSLLLETPTRIGIIIIIITAIVLFSLFSDTVLFSSSVFAFVYNAASAAAVFFSFT